MGETARRPAEATIRSAEKRPHAFSAIVARTGAALGKTGIHPDVFTLVSLVVAAGAAWLLATGSFVVAPFVFFAAAVLDLLDGAVARATGKVSAAGGYLDSLIDRYVDFLVLFGVMLAIDTTTMWILGSVALFGVLVTPGAKWRVHEDHHPTRAEWGRDLFERAERYWLLLPGILLHGVWTHYGLGGSPIHWVVALVAILANLTVLQRIVKARRVLRNMPRT